MSFHTDPPWTLKTELPPLNGKIVIFDLEMTTWPGTAGRYWAGEDEDPEIVQIGAVEIDTTRSFQETKTFSQLVRPIFHPTLSSYFIKLTGITQEKVESKGLPFNDALNAFKVFCRDATTLISNGQDAKVLDINCSLHKTSFPFEKNLFIDLSQWLRNRITNDDTHIVSSDLLSRLGIEDDTKSHNALADARRIAHAIGHLTNKHTV